MLPHGAAGRSNMSDLVMALLVIVLFTCMLVAHFSLAFVIGKRAHGTASWLLLGVLSTATSLVWEFLGLIVALISLFPSEPEGWRPVVEWTFGLLVNTMPIEMRSMIPTALDHLVSVIILACMLYLLALLPFAFARRSQRVGKN
jgi:hypothetical protein